MQSKQVTFKGVEHPVYFGFGALYLIEKITGVPFSKIGELFVDISLDTLITMLEVGLKEGARKEGKEYTFDREKLIDALDEYGVQRFTEIIETLISFFVSEEAKEKSGEQSPPPVV